MQNVIFNLRLQLKFDVLFHFFTKKTKIRKYSVSVKILSKNGV